MKRFFARAKALLPCIGLGLALAPSAFAQPPIITNWDDLRAAVRRGGMSIFASNATVNLSGESETLGVTTAVVLNASTNLDGTTNTATINRTSGSGLTFLILPGGSLTLFNLTISGGLNTNGGAIFNSAGGILIISNCLFTGNTATNFAGVAGLDGTFPGNNNGGSGGNGLSASGGAISSQGVLKVFYSIFDNNSVQGGNGGNGGNGVESGGIFGGNAGNGGSGGSAQGGAIVCSGPTNIFVASAFTGNRCTAGSGGSAGTPATGAFSGNPGSGGLGGGSAGGAILASGPVFMTNCLFAQNTVVAGDTSSLDQAGGSATGGGLDVAGSTKTAFIENTTFNQNSCQGGAGGGNSSLVFHPAGNGGSATGGGLASAAALTVVRNCTLATNTLIGGAAGVSSTTESNGLPGLTPGFDLARTAGTLKMAGSILSGGTNATATNFLTLTLTTYITNATPNDSGGLTDLGYNFSSDTSVALLTALGSIVNTNPYLDTSLTTPGNTVVGLLGGSDGQTLAVFTGSPSSPAIGAVPGIPGLTFPAYDQVYQPRSSPTTMGAYEANPLDLTTASPPTIVTPPSDFATKAGGAAFFQVTADAGSTPLGYQWQFNGTNLADSARISGAWSNILTIKSVTTNDMGSYSVLVGASTLIDGGVISSETNVLTVFVPVTIQTQPPKSVKPVPGIPLNLSVVASGAAPLTFQWYLNETNMLSDDFEITGSTTSNLTIYPLAPDNAGNYSVVVSNPYGSVTSFLVTLSIPLPSLTILPTLSGVLTPSLTVLGTAAGEFGVTNVQYQLDGQAWAEATLLTQTNWSATVTLQPGTNIFSAFSVDLLGQVSRTKSVAIFFTNFATLTLTTSGSGKITPVFTNNSLVEGRNYTLTALPNPGNLFSNWTGPFTTTNNPLTFQLDSDTAWQANFVTNFFLPAAGTYNGLFSSTNGVTPQSAGMISGLMVKTNGLFSGKLLLAGASYPLTGRFDILGHALVSAGPANAPGGQLQVELFLEPAPASQISGTVSNTLWTANLIAGLAGKGLPSPQYTMLLPPPAGAGANSPPGDGYALAASHAGIVTLGGALADGTVFNQNVPVSATGGVPVYASLYKNTGLLFGWVNLTNGQAAPPTNLLTWITPSAADALYPDGFTNSIPVQAAPWVAPTASTPAIPFPGGLLIVSNSGLDLAFDVAVSNNNALARLGGVPLNSLTGSINPKTGLLSVTFGNGNGKAAGAGAVLQSSNSAAGFFVTKAAAGLITLQTNLAGLDPMLFQQPAGLNFAPNTSARFSVLAVGSPLLSYQWRLNGTPLADGGNISGSATAQLNLTPALLANAGSYSVVVSNSYGAATSSVAVLAVPPPTLTLKPFLSAVTSPALTVQGSASGKFGVTNVLYQLNNGPWTPASSSSQWTNWSAPVALQPGTNVFRAFSVDPVGDSSAVQTAPIFYLTQSAITLLTSGPGRISPGFTGNLLAVGRNYTVTAVPDPGNLFSNWTGAVSSTADPLKFVMVSNMVLTASFVPNFFLPSAGIYNGLFFSANGVAQESSGMLYDLVLKTNGLYTGRLFVAGTNYSLSGGFDIFGHAAASFGSSNAPGGPLLLDMTLQKAPTNQILGTVSSNSWVANLTAELAGNALPSAQYTMLFSAFNASTNFPPGDGYALVTNHAGLVSLTGALADGIPLTPSVPSSANGDLPVYASLYHDTGLLFGWINLNNLQAAPPANLLTWIKKPSGPATLYSAGFTNTLSLQGALWTAPPANSPAISYHKGNLSITNTSFDLEFTVAVLGNNSLTKLGGTPPNSLTGSIAPATGWLKLAFGNGNGASTIQGMGAVLQDQNIAGGFFLTATNAGSIILGSPQ